MRNSSILPWPGLPYVLPLRDARPADTAATTDYARTARWPRVPLTARGGFQLVDQVRAFLRAQGESDPVPILGGFVAEPRLDGRVFVYWRLPGLSVFEAARRRASLLHYQRLLRSWATETELHLDAPEPYVACWIGA
jgi:hypothetical protein